MSKRPQNQFFLLFGLIALAMYPQTAYAYVDPGSGSVIVTAILGLFAAIGYTVRKQFYKIKRVFGGGTENNEEGLDNNEKDK